MSAWAERTLNEEHVTLKREREEGVVDAVVTNTFNDDVIGGVFVSLLIIYYLGRSPRKNNTNADSEIENNNRDEIDIDFEMEELDEEFDESLEDSEQIQTNYNSPRVNKPNPVRDKQSFLSRLFQGRTDRY